MSSSLPAGYRPSFDNCHAVSAICPVSFTTYGDYFNLAPCIFFTVFFTLCLAWQLGIGIKYRTWSFTIFLAIGTVFEVMGYAARISMSDIGGATVWSYPAFVIQLLMLILAPTMVAAAISVTFKWIVIYLDPRYSILKPKWYPWVFVGTDFISIIIQAVGGAVSAGATSKGTANQKLLNAGTGLLVAGVAFQAANMAFCGGLMVIYWTRYRGGKKRGEIMDGVRAREGDVGAVRREKRFKMYLYAIIIAYIAILIRCVYRIPEMALGWGSRLMKNETLFLILDGAMVALAVLLLTVVHPAIFFPVLRRPRKNAAAAIDAEKETRSGTPTSTPEQTIRSETPEQRGRVPMSGL